MQLEVKTILNRIQHFAGFVYQEVRLHTPRGKLRIEVHIEPHRGLRGKCSEFHVGKYVEQNSRREITWRKSRVKGPQCGNRCIGTRDRKDLRGA